MTKFINQVQNATNMIVVEGILSSATFSFLELYSHTVKPIPQAKTGLQAQWIKDATTFYKSDILSTKMAIIQAIPVRMHNTEMYKKLIAKYK